ncbi:recombinase RecX [Longibacter salinarum]|uniref:Regulatory protein RecX n=1 Tax=Longibacter salinarum TaxID=1850348 RepID=A0A2A8D0P9_9BACT|nr:RecX family transcriptional regulator [Longibacter salinarum]PEN14495.1 recombinase RecX [Longibacter salinarum]
MPDSADERSSRDIFQEAAAETAAREAETGTSESPESASTGEEALPFEESVPEGPDTRRITDIQTQKKDDARVSVFVDGEFAFGCHQDVAAKHGLHQGQTLTPEMQQEVEVDEEIVRAKQRAFKYLAHKPRTETEVRRKLRGLDLGRRVIDRVIERLYELDYLDDEQYARDYTHNRFSNKGYGPIRIERELTERGIDRHLAERTVARFFEEASELDAAREQARKRWPRVAGEQDVRKQKRKLLGYLQRRGFTPDVVYRVVDEFVDP